MPKTISLFPDDKADFRTRGAEAMATLREHPGSTLRLAPGQYRLSSPLARETQDRVMAGDFGPDPQVVLFKPNHVYDRGLDFSNQTGTRVEARGVTFMVDGFMEPISMEHSRDLEFSGISIDHLRKPFSMGRVGAVTADGEWHRVQVVFGDEYPVLPGTPLRLRCCTWDPDTRRFTPFPSKSVQWLDEHTVEYLAEYPGGARPGVEFYAWHSLHSRPAVRLENCQGIRLVNLTLHSQPGMGIVGHRCENLYIEGLRVIPPVGVHLSTNTDATHFTSCKGSLHLSGCLFEGQGDDSLNVHGYYHRITPVGAKTCRLKMDFKDGTHTQTLDYPDAGDTLELTRRDSLEALDRFLVVACEPHPEMGDALVILDRDLPADASACFMADITRLPFLTYVNNASRNHYARGILVKTRGALIENNRFADLWGMGIEIAAESGWQEGVCPADITIRRNQIVHCGSARRAALCVMADCEKPTGTPIRNVIIEDNWIDCPEAPHGIFLRGIDGYRLEGNQVRSRGEPVVVENCIPFPRDFSAEAQGEIPASREILAHGINNGNSPPSRT